MTRDTAVRSTATRGLVVAVCVWLVVAPLAAGVAGAGAPREPREPREPGSLQHPPTSDRTSIIICHSDVRYIPGKPCT
jgi:hypothetical protein